MLEHERSVSPVQYKENFLKYLLKLSAQQSNPSTFSFTVVPNRTVLFIGWQKPDFL